MKKYQIAVLDDYQDVALESADWSVLREPGRYRRISQPSLARRASVRTSFDGILVGRVEAMHYFQSPTHRSYL
jgi:hypothetical protein